MKRILLTGFLTVILSAFSFAQLTWYTQNSGTTTQLTAISFVDQNNGWISGEIGTMLHTTDGGQTWNYQTVPTPYGLYSVFFTDAQNGWTTGEGGNIFHTTDGGQNWVSQLTSIPIDLHDLFFINADTGWAAGGDPPSFPSSSDRIILGTTDGGNTWNIQYFQSDATVMQIIFFIDSNNGYATGGSGELMHTTNGGNVWTQQLVANGNDFRNLFFTDLNTGWVTGDGGFPSHGVVYKTTDSGSTWNETILGPDQLLLGMYFNDEQNGWIVGVDYSNGNMGIVYRTTDAGTNWVNQSIPSIDALFKIIFINSNTGWATGGNGNIITTEGSTPVELSSFTAEVNGNNVGLNWRTATEKNNSGFEIFRSIKYDNNWNQIGFVEGHGTTTDENNYSFTDKNLKAGSYSYKLVQVDFDGTQNESKIINVEVSSQPKEYSLSQNYPNPFNPSTTIEYSIPEGGNVKLVVYNSLGEEVAVLENNFEEAGSYKINFDASKLSSGIYYYRLNSGEFSSIKKMIILK